MGAAKVSYLGEFAKDNPTAAANSKPLSDDANKDKAISGILVQSHRDARAGCRGSSRPTDARWGGRSY